MNLSFNTRFGASFKVHGKYHETQRIESLIRRMKELDDTFAKKHAVGAAQVDGYWCTRVNYPSNILTQKEVRAIYARAKKETAYIQV